jgi:L-malate glycosyltransferase
VKDLRHPVRRIYQVLPSLSQRDAIGTDTRMIDEYFQSKGIPSAIFYGDSGSANLGRPIAEMVDRFMNETLVIYHFSVYSHLAYHLASLPCRIWSRYHNITPPHFFNSHSEGMVREICRTGRTQIPFVAAISDLVISDSTYNGEEMRPFTQVPIHTLPIFRDYDALSRLADDQALAAQLKAIGDPVLLFVGRVVPNKCQHDIVQLAYLYRKATGKRARVVLAGTFFSTEYRKSILDFASALGMVVAEKFDRDADVMVLGSISDAELSTLYRHSQAFVSMSEHEGFGVPLVESLWFDLPVIAHESSAVAETLGGAGILVDKNDWAGAVGALHGVLSQGCSDRLRQQMIQRRQELSVANSAAILQSLLDQHVAPKW